MTHLLLDLIPFGVGCLIGFGLFLYGMRLDKRRLNPATPQHEFEALCRQTTRLVQYIIGCPALGLLWSIGWLMFDWSRTP